MKQTFSSHRIAYFHRLILLIGVLCALGTFSNKSFATASSLTIFLTPPASNLPPANAVPSGVDYGFDISYSCTGIPDGGTLTIELPNPYYQTGLNSSPTVALQYGGTSGIPVTPLQTFALVTPTSSSPVFKCVISGITSSTSGAFQVYYHFPKGSTCNGATICDTARMMQGNDSDWAYSSLLCITDYAKNGWSFSLDRYAGCAMCDNEVIYLAGFNNSLGNTGSLNLNGAQVKLTFPSPNAQIVDVTLNSANGPSIINNPAWQHSAIHTNTITVDPLSPLLTNTYHVDLYFHVQFCDTIGFIEQPTARFQGFVETDCVNGTTLDTSIRADTMSICAVKDSGSMIKTFYQITNAPDNPQYYPNRLYPGCCGTYNIVYTNQGNVSQTGIVIDDVIPPQMDVQNDGIFTTIPQNSGITATVTAYDANNNPVTLQTSSGATSLTQNGTVYLPSGFVMPVKEIKWIYTGSLSQLETLNTSFDVCVDPSVTVPSVITNTAMSTDANDSIHTGSIKIPLLKPAPYLVAEKTFIGACTPQGAQQTSPYFPGDIVRFRIAVSNLGSADATTCSIVDNLPAGFSYAGNETYLYTILSPAGNWIEPSNPSCNSLLPAGSSNLDLTLLGLTPIGTAPTHPAITTAGTTHCVWTFPTLPHHCDGSPYYFFIEFDVRVNDTTVAGSYPNRFSVSGFDSSTSRRDTVTSNYAYVTVGSKTVMVATKLVRRTPGGTFADNANIPPGGTGEYQITLQNTGNVPLANLRLLDIMPHPMDYDVLPISGVYGQRGSNLNVPLSGAVIMTAPAGFTTTYSTSNEPSRIHSVNGGLGWCGFSPDFVPPGTSFGPYLSSSAYYSFTVLPSTPATILSAGATITIRIPFTIPLTAQPGNLACNSFAYEAYPQGDTGAHLFAESKACVTVVRDTSTACTCPCDSISWTPDASEVSEEDGRIYTIHNPTCRGPIDSIELHYLNAATGAAISVSDLNGIHGGLLTLYRDPAPPYLQSPASDAWFNGSNQYQSIPSWQHGGIIPRSGTPATQDRISFRIGLNIYNHGPSTWQIRITIYYDNGDTCTQFLPDWSPGSPTTTGAVVPTGNARSYVASFTIDRSKYQELIGSVVVSVQDSNDRIIGATGAPWEAVPDTSQSKAIRNFLQSSRAALFNIDERYGTLPEFKVFIAPHDSTIKPKVVVRVYGQTADLLSEDTGIVATSTTSAVFQPTSIMPNTGIDIESIQPNPSQYAIDITYTTGSGGDARLEIFDLLGNNVGTITDGYQPEGEHSAHFDLGGLHNGTYFVRLSNHFGQTSREFKIVR